MTTQNESHTHRERDVIHLHLSITVYQKILQEVEEAHTVSVLVFFLSKTVVGGFMHLTATLGGNVVVVSSQQEQSLLYVEVWAGSVTEHCLKLLGIISTCLRQVLYTREYLPWFTRRDGLGAGDEIFRLPWSFAGLRRGGRQRRLTASGRLAACHGRCTWRARSRSWTNLLP